jgi:hypothetical protein
MFWQFRRPDMSLLKKLFWWKRDRPARIRICVECGMPIAEHKEWCSIFRTLQAARKGSLESTPAQ